jgi:hypothetical protein
MIDRLLKGLGGDCFGSALPFVMVCVVVLATACSGAPAADDTKVADDSTPAASAVSDDPHAAARAWLSTDATQAFAQVLGDAPVVERIWAEDVTYRALVARPEASNGEGAAVLLTLERAKNGWQVTHAEEADADLLWPGI